MVALAKLRDAAFQGHGSLTKGQRLLGEKTLEELLNDIITNANTEALTSAATAGGAATEAALAVTGLLATDEILSVTTVAGGNAVGFVGYANQIDGAIDITFSADPGAGRTVTVLVRHAVS